MSKAKKVAILLSAFLCIPPFINLTGWNLYTYINIGERDLILASAVGSSHLAWAERYDDPAAFILLEIEYEDLKRDLLKAGPIHIYAEQRSTHFQFFTFNWIKPSDGFYYAGIEFPWLLFLLMPAGVWIWSDRSNTNSRPTKPHAEKPL